MEGVQTAMGPPIAFIALCILLPSAAASTSSMIAPLGSPVRESAVIARHTPDLMALQKAKSPLTSSPQGGATYPGKEVISLDSGDFSGKAGAETLLLTRPAPVTQEGESIRSLQDQRHSTQRTNEKTRSVGDVNGILQGVQNQVFGFDVGAPGELLGEKLPSELPGGEVHVQSQQVFWNASGRTTTPQQVNLSQVLIQNAPQFFLNWDQPGGEKQDGSDKAKQQYDWRKHVQRRPSRSEAGAVSREQQLAERARERELLKDVFSLWLEVDSRQLRLTEQQKLRQQLQALVAKQFELLKQLYRLEHEYNSETPQASLQPRSSALIVEGKCSLANTVIADSYAQVKQQSQLLLNLTLPAPTVFLPGHPTLALSTAVGYPVQLRSMHQGTIPQLTGTSISPSVKENEGRDTEPIEHTNPPEAPSALQAPALPDSQEKQLQSTGPLLAQDLRQEKNLLASSQKTHQPISVSSSDRELESRPKQRLPGPDVPRHRGGLHASDGRAEIRPHDAMPAVSQPSAVVALRDEEEVEVKEADTTHIDSKDRNGAATLESSVAGGSSVDSTSYVLSTADGGSQHSESVTPNQEFFGRDSSPLGLSGGNDLSARLRHPDPIKSDEERTTEIPDTRGSAHVAINGERQDAGKPEPEKSLPLGGTQQRRNGGVEYDGLMSSRLRQLQKQQEDHLAALFRQLELQQEELATRSRLLDRQREELLRLQEHFRELTARRNSLHQQHPAQATTTPPAKVYPVAQKSGGPQVEDADEVDLQNTFPAREPLLESDGERRLQALSENTPIHHYICKVIGHACSSDEECCEDLMCTQPSFIRTEPQRPDGRGTCQQPSNVAGFPSTPAWMTGQDEVAEGSPFFRDYRRRVGSSSAPLPQNSVASFVNRYRVPPNSRLLSDEKDVLQIEAE
ncbi:hypothetical protein BESB_084500 [Besnoitia besnoiti]|uniref:Uncharacterized protein n=1 Tax=Besnoitia besnoiti TaxID=94643 RepID=A0A2A9MAA8_BESBE|nr:hypothetical protein BESB_084500 [Besnoitia besnoiti]PFH33251.1 hypothetical protein BESB_084500 [Besnoitia besnoiti]